MDMKQIKAGCWSIIKNAVRKNEAEGVPMEVDGVEQARGVTLKFSEVRKELPNVVSEKCAQSVSTGLAFYSILHLCNEKGLEIEQQANLADLTIIPPPSADLSQD